MFLTFRSGGQRLAVALGRIREVVSAAEPLTLPGGRCGLRGIVVRDGVAIPIVDLEALAGGRSSTPDGGDAIVLDAGETRVGLLAAEANAAEADPVPPGEKEPPEGWTWIAGRVIVGGRDCFLLDPDGLALSLSTGAGGGRR